jgi:hypothetical protein
MNSCKVSGFSLKSQCVEYINKIWPAFIRFPIAGYPKEVMISSRSFDKLKPCFLQYFSENKALRLSCCIFQCNNHPKPSPIDEAKLEFQEKALSFHRATSFSSLRRRSITHRLGANRKFGTNCRITCHCRCSSCTCFNCECSSSS